MYGGRMGGGGGRGRGGKVPPEEDVPELKFGELLRLLRPYFWPDGASNRVRSVLCFFILGVSKFCNIIAPIFLGRAINDLSEKKTVPTDDICLYIMFAFLTKALRELQNYTYLGVQQAAYIDLAKNTFRHLHSLSLDWHLSRKTGKVLRAMDRGINSANTVVRMVFLYLVPTIVECIVVCIIFATRYGSPGIAAAAFGGVALYCLSTYFMALWRARIRQRMNDQDNDSHDKAVDSLVNFETVKYFTNEEFELERYAGALRRFQKAAVQTQASLNLLNSVQQVIIQGATLVAMLLVAGRIADGDLRIGDFTAVTVYIMQLFQPLSFLGSIYSAVVQAVVDMRNLSQLFAQSPGVKDSPGAGTLSIKGADEGAEVEFKDVVFRYPKQQEGQGIQGISFRVPAGKTLGIVGHTGAGKSTISRLLFRFYDPQQGSITVGGQPIHTVSQRSLRQQIGIVPQDCVLFNDTVGYNIGYGKPGVAESELWNAARTAQIDGFIERQEKGLKTMVGERGLKLSGGEKQRVAIARTLLKNPPVLVLDEATSSLDTITEQAIQDALTRVRRGRTTIVIAHRLSTVKDADEIIVLDAGKIVERGTHTDLLAKQGHYRGLWDRQAASQDGGTASSLKRLHVRLHSTDLSASPTGLRTEKSSFAAQPPASNPAQSTEPPVEDDAASHSGSTVVDGDADEEREAAVVTGTESDEDVAGDASPADVAADVGVGAGSTGETGAEEEEEEEEEKR